MVRQVRDVRTNAEGTVEEAATKSVSLHSVTPTAMFWIMAFTIHTTAKMELRSRSIVEVPIARVGCMTTVYYGWIPDDLCAIYAERFLFRVLFVNTCHLAVSSD